MSIPKFVVQNSIYPFKLYLLVIDNFYFRYNENNKVV